MIGRICRCRVTPRWSRSLPVSAGRIGLALALATSAFLQAAEPPAQDAHANLLTALDRGVGQPLSMNFKLIGLDDKPISFRQFIGKKAVVIVFIGTDCPIGNLYMPTLVELAKEYEPRGIQFVLVNSNQSETLDDMRKHAEEYGLNGVPGLLVAKDPGNELADLALAERTNEAILIDATLDFLNKLARIRYRGMIDDQYHYNARRDQPKRTPLKDALEDFLAGREVRVAGTEVQGCLIERGAPKVLVDRQGAMVRTMPEEIRAEFAKARAIEPIAVGPVTYHKDVAPIVQAKCQTCHRPNQVAPFSLLTYEQAKRWKGMIREVVDEGRMPPWHANPNYGAFANDRSLTPLERAILLAWVDQDAPEGNPADSPAPRTFAEGWTIGKPDLIIEMPRTHIVPAGGVVDYVRYPVDFEVKEDLWIQAIEARPGDPAVVHHIILYYVLPGDPAPRYLVGYAPGDLSETFPEGTAKRLPKGSRFFFEMHYTPIGKVRQDKSSVGIVLAKTPPTRETITRPIASRELEQRLISIPPGHPNYPITSAIEFKTDVELIGMMPHMHLRGKDFRYILTDPQGKETILLDVPAYDFAWQNFYWTKQPIPIPAGSRIDCVAHFDNSEDNPYNPDPSASVTWGDQTYEEMMIGFIEYTVPLDIQGSWTQHAKRVTPKLVPGQDPLPEARPSTGAAGLLNRLLGGLNPATTPKTAPTTTPTRSDPGQ